MRKQKDYPFHSVEEEAEHHKLGKRLPIQHVPTYELAFMDEEFLLRHDLRAIRLQLEYLKAELTHNEQNIESTIVVFGSARISPEEIAEEELSQAETYSKSYPNDPEGKNDLTRAKYNVKKSFYYEQARLFAKIVSTSKQAKEHGNFVVTTGGGPGIMEAANRGARENGGKSIGLSIYLPTEEANNKYISPELHLQFHYFALRKMQFLNRARALIFFPGGFGTLDELFESLTLMQTKKMKRIPVLLFGEEYWRNLINFEALVTEGAIAPDDLDLFEFVETAEDAWNLILQFYSVDS